MFEKHWPVPHLGMHAIWGCLMEMYSGVYSGSYFVVLLSICQIGITMQPDKQFGSALSSPQQTRAMHYCGQFPHLSNLIHHINKKRKTCSLHAEKIKVGKYRKGERTR